MATNLVTVEQASEILDVSLGTVRDWIRSGKIKSYYDDEARRYMLDRWNVEFLAKRRKSYLTK